MCVPSERYIVFLPGSNLNADRGSNLRAETQVGLFSCKGDARGRGRIGRFRGYRYFVKYVHFWPPTVSSRPAVELPGAYMLTSRQPDRTLPMAPRWQRSRSVEDRVLATFIHACDHGALEIAGQLLGVYETMLAGPPLSKGAARRREKNLLIAAHASLWEFIRLSAGEQWPGKESAAVGGTVHYPSSTVSEKARR